MGTFSITPRSERLGNIQGGGVRQVHVPNHYIGDGATSMWNAVANVGRGMASEAHAWGGIAAQMINEKRMIQDNEVETDFVSSMRTKMEDPKTGLLMRVGTAGNSETLQGCVDEGTDYFKHAAEQALKDKGYSGMRKERMMMRLRQAAMPFERAMSGSVLKKTTELKVAASDKNFGELLETWHGHMTDAEATQNVIDSFRASQRARGLADAEVDANAEKIWKSMAYDYVARNIVSANRSQLDWIEQHSKDGSTGDLFAMNGALAEHFAGRDALGEAIGKRNGGTLTARDGIKAAIIQRRHELDVEDRRLVDETANVGVSAVAAIRDKDGHYPAARLETVETTIESLTKLAKSMPQGGNAATAAATAASDLNAKADMIAQQEMIDTYLHELDKDPNARIYIGATKDAKGNVVTSEQNSYFGQGRKERLAPMVQQLVDQQRGQPAASQMRKAKVGEQRGQPAASQMRKAKVGELEMNMLAYANNPGEYHSVVYRAARDGEIGLDDYRKLTNKFDESWARGFKPGFKSEKQKQAEGMLEVIQRYFPSTELAASYEWDGKTSSMKLKEDAAYQGLEYEVKEGRGSFLRSFGEAAGFLTPGTRSVRKLDQTMVEKIVNVATELSFYNGQQLEVDPITGESTDFFTGKEIKKGKDAPKFDAVKYFERYMRLLTDVESSKKTADFLAGLSDEKRRQTVQSHAQEADDPMNYVTKLSEGRKRLGAKTEEIEEDRAKAIAKSEGGRLKKTVTIRNRKPGEGVTSGK